MLVPLRWFQRRLAGNYDVGTIYVGATSGRQQRAHGKRRSSS